jgi:hypothetical protein
MYVPVWPSLSPVYFAGRDVGGDAPFPLNHPGNAYFYVARSGIYHLARALGLGDGGIAGARLL